MSGKKDIKGFRSGNLTAIKPTKLRTKNGSIIWECICDCGNIVQASSRSMLIGDIKKCEKCRKPSYYITIEIPRRKGREKQFAQIDIEDFPKVQEHNWHIANGYVRAKINGNYAFLHQVIMGFPEQGIDHVDMNKLNNRKNNLRLCSGMQNAANTMLFSHNTSGYKGVTWDKNRSKYMAKIKVHQRTINLGRFDTAEQAAIAYNERAKIEFGTFARLNTVGDHTGYNTIKN